MTPTQRLLHFFKSASVINRLIIINIVIFVSVYLFRVVGFFFNLDFNAANSFVVEWFGFSKNLGDLLHKPWSLVSYAFLHGGLWHLLVNMWILYFAGSYFTNYFSSKRLLNFYFLGAMAGALFFSLSYNLFPAFANSGNIPLIGASAAVMAVLVGIATHIPHMGVRLLFLGTIKLWHIAAFFVLLDIILIPTSNAGGRLAHLGGALLGYTYAKQLAKGNDIGKWWERLMDAMVNLFRPRKDKPLRTVHRSKKATARKKTTPTPSKNEQQKRIDAILDKISKSGYDSLSKAEKDFLFKAGKE